MKNFFEKSSIRRIRLTFTILFAAVFIVCIINAEFVLFRYALSNDQCAWREIPGNDSAFVITDIVPGGVSDAAGLKNGDILIGINGINITSNQNDTTRVFPMILVNSIPKGTFADYSILRNGEALTIKVQMEKVFDFVYAVNFLFGLFFLISGFIVVISKPKGITQRVFAYFTILIMLAFGLSQVNLQNYPQIIFKSLYIGLIAFTRIIGPYAILNFFFYFPVNHRSKIDKILLYSVLAVSFVVSIFSFIFNREVNNFITGFRVDNVPVVRLFLGNIVFIFLIWGLFIFAFRYFKHVPLNRRKSLRPILFSSIISIAFYLYTLKINVSNQFTIFIEPQNLLQYILIILLPLSFGYSIFKYRLMDTELVLKKSIVYGFVTAVIAAIYVLFVFRAGELFGGITGNYDNGAISIIAIIIIAFIFDPLKRLVQDYVDRIFYREKTNYQKIIKEFTQKLPLQNRQDLILNSVTDIISTAMHVDKVAVVVFVDDAVKYAQKNIEPEYCSFNGQYSGLKAYLEKYKEPQIISLLKEETTSEKDRSGLDFITESGIELSVPMIMHDKLIGMINTGKKLSEKNYTEEEIDLLMTVANQTAIAIENSRLYERERTFYQTEHELELASRIQLEWLPKSSPVIKGFDIYGSTKPAKKVGGDYFDFIRIDDNKLTLCLGDVSGKGLPAALLMANLQAIMSSQASISYSTAECVEQANKLLFTRTNDSMFVTLFCSFLDVNSSTLQFTNAGHNYPILINSSDIHEELSAGGIVMGIQPDASYNFESKTLMKGDVLVIYSDGISEQTNAEGDMFSESRLTDLIIKNKFRSASDLSKVVFKCLETFRGELDQADDMTLIILKKL